MAYAYNCDIFCDDCGAIIIEDCDKKGQEDTGDTNEYPQHGSDDEETDSPQHCASGEECPNAITLSDGTKIGCLIGTSLTTDGVEYVKEAVKEGGLCATEVWREEFSWIDFPPCWDNAVKKLSREECVELLTSVDIQCYDHETLETLQEAVRVNLEDGTLDKDMVDPD